jgi:hypothetical protein
MAIAGYCTHCDKVILEQDKQLFINGLVEQITEQTLSPILDESRPRNS